MSLSAGGEANTALPCLSIIVPVLDEADRIVPALSALAPLRSAGAELIVVDGGSTDATVARATPLCDRLLAAPRGRACQMNAGVHAAGGALLIFLHVDTALPDGALAELQAAQQAGASWGRFDVRITGTSRWFGVISAMMNWRSRWTGIATGDQAMFVRRAQFFEVGGFPEQPLMEDIELSVRLRRIQRPWCSRLRVSTSGRRWERHGLVRTIVLMWVLRLRYFFGADPVQLAKAYGYLPRDEAAAPDSKARGQR